MQEKPSLSDYNSFSLLRNFDNSNSGKIEFCNAKQVQNIFLYYLYYFNGIRVRCGFQTTTFDSF